MWRKRSRSKEEEGRGGGEAAFEVVSHVDSSQTSERFECSPPGRSF